MSVEVVWFKRDLRLRDHAPLCQAMASKRPVLLIYIVEPSQLEDPHFDLRHWRFIYQSIQDLNQQLASTDNRIFILHGEALDVFSSIQRYYGQFTLHSSQEIGVTSTFSRDIAVANWCNAEGIRWHQQPYAGVTRGAKNRHRWDENWMAVMRACPLRFNAHELRSAPPPPSELNYSPPSAWLETNEKMQRGGENWAWKTLHSFSKGRGKRFHLDISKPLAARKACSRLSPYLAWGNISMRETYQYFSQLANEPGWQRPMNAAVSRLHWHCHFIQKFESETRMEHQPVNRAYESFPHRKDDQLAHDLEAWCEGRTGVPLVDACMRCVVATGYLNFRMRAMLVSFLCHHLNIDWRLGVHHLARQFLDFEPGIHYPQFQMQAGMTGINTIRIYNPVKQAQEHDPEASFIKQWLPELVDIPAPLVFSPWELSPMELTMYGLTLGVDYPAPIINVDTAAAEARDRLWGFKAKHDVKHEAKRILDRHVRQASA